MLSDVICWKIKWILAFQSLRNGHLQCNSKFSIQKSCQYINLIKGTLPQISIKCNANPLFTSQSRYTGKMTFLETDRCLLQARLVLNIWIIKYWRLKAGATGGFLMGVTINTGLTVYQRLSKTVKFNTDWSDLPVISIIW